MEKLARVLVKPLMVLTLGIFMSCEGPVGPPGPPGADGLDGDSILGEVFEVDATFTAQGEFSVLGEYGYEIFESDKVMIFHLFDVVDGRDVWRPLPHTIYLENGIFTYAYDFTTEDFSIFINGNFNLATLGPEWLQDQVFRILIIPADFANGRIDFNDMEGLMRKLGKEESDIKRIAL